MPRNQTIRAAILVIAALLVSSSVAKATDLVFPLEGPKILTATFGEYRINHPHGGIDLGTGGVEGLPVVAAAAGRALRLRASPVAYGKVVYLSHAGGFETVYAHLSEFGPKLQVFADQAQSPGRYVFNRFFQAGGPTFAAGELLGYSGTTGTDVPHLHFEVRRGGLPVNPLRNGVRLVDTIAPRIEKLLVEPLSADAFGPDGFARTVIDIPPEGLTTPVTVAGNVGLAVQITDRIDGSHRDLAPYEFRVEENGETTYHVRYERFDYADKTVSELDYHYELKETQVGVFHRLYRHSRSIPFYEKTSAAIDGLRHPPGDRVLTITARDAAGNESRTVIRLRVEAPAPALPEAPPGEPGRAIPSASIALRDRVLFSELPLAPGETLASATARLKTAGGERALPVRRHGRTLAVDIDAGGYLRLDAQTSAGRYSWSGEVQWVRDGAIIASPGGAAISVPKGAVVREFPIVAYTREPSQPAPGLAASAPVHVFAQPWEPIRRNMNLSLAGAPAGTDVYLLDRGTYWFMSGGSKASVTHFGAFLAAVDRSPPRIESIAFETLRGRKVIVARYVEEGAGIPNHGARMWVNGVEVLAELMPVGSAVRHIPPAPIVGTTRVRVRVTDRNGLSGEKTVELDGAISSRPAGS